MPKDAQLMDVAVSICKNKGFVLHKFIDSGAYKETYHMSNNHFDYALKIFNSKNANERSDRELSAMQRLNSSNIAKLIEVDKVEHNGIEYLFILEEYLGGGTLSSVIKNQSLDRQWILSIGSDLISALICTQEINIVHRDIKPDNIMFRESDSQAVLVDFGLVRDLNAVSLTHAFIPQGPGTPYFSSPEQLTNKKSLIDWRSDQFSLGVTLCFSLFGTHPFLKTTVEETLQAVSSFSSCNDEVKRQLTELKLTPIIKMLEPYPVQRYRLPNMLYSDWQKL